MMHLVVQGYWQVPNPHLQHHLVEGALYDVDDGALLRLVALGVCAIETLAGVGTILCVQDVSISNRTGLEHCRGEARCSATMGLITQMMQQIAHKEDCGAKVRAALSHAMLSSTALSCCVEQQVSIMLSQMSIHAQTQALACIMRVL